MTTLRHLLLRHPAGALALLLATLAVRLLVPAGYMPDVGAGQATLVLCSGMGPMAGPMTEMPGRHDPAKPASDAPCGFGGLAIGGTGGDVATPEAPRFIFALPFSRRIADVAPIAAPRRLRPPLRAPPFPAPRRLTPPPRRRIRRPPRTLVMIRSSALRIAALCAGAAVSSPVLACASCGCTLTADWLAQGLVAQPGTTIDLRYDYIPQTRLRSEGHAVDRGAIAFPTDREIEKYTYNHYLTASLDRQFDSDWGVNLQVPLIYRPHATTDEDDTELSYSHTNGLGDVRITGRWQGFKEKGSINGIQFGIQLPTGRINEQFTKGPNDGEAVDRGLQPGFGVTQAILGYYRYGKLATDFDYIFQVQGQLPLYRHDLYRPGKIGQVSAGVHYTRWRGVTPQLQLNFRVSEKDRGENSDTYNTGGEQLYAAPGVIASLGHGASAFAYLQVPVYQRVVGYQITPRATVSVGLSYRL